MRPYSKAIRNRFWSFTVFPFLVLSFFLIQEGVALAQKAATLSKVQGNVRVFEAGSNRGKKGRDGMALFVNSTIKTLGANSRADIIYIRGDVVRVMPNTDVTLGDTRLEEDKSTTKLKLAAGKIFNVVNKLTEGSTYEVQTRTATAGVKGTVWSAETASQDTFMVKEGKVEVDAAQQKVLVADLKKSTVQGGQPPGDPQDLSPEEIAMFDILDDLLESIKTDIKEEIQESIKEDIIQNAIENEMDMDMH
ncbi:MAG: FecR domain-containing protein [Candidatus Nitronauta litoralis]|uniref:FecR domain-containing protein n=1 Tax=Candidatus Nitronauta litoralis TaxID=2705533 RepID=A0A7T0BU75_9BACT|nr:MAG: FecR domain-containing protein [Candidatus Nitronauta litoralis]